MKHTPYPLGRLEGDSPGQARRMGLFPFPGGISSRVSKFWRQDGLWGNQGNTGTCVAFAEMHRMADAPVMRYGITHDMVFELYAAATGDTSLQEGTWANVVAEELLRRGKISRFEWITSAGDLEFAVLEKGPIPIGIPWYNSMFFPERRADGRMWVKVDSASGLAGGHEVLLNGLRLDQPDEPVPFFEPFYRVKNSWGKSWGDGGTARIAVADVNRLVFDDWGDAIWLKEVRP